ncbi:MAG: leucine-rich repeat domain-containing protein [Erysipelotrichaceae bacterium]|nr:leucine-rich repeat domain-containing protein [Erysipelotrichaceae bacterium]
MIAVKCPVCLENVQLPEGRERGYCSSCGAQIICERPAQQTVVLNQHPIAKRADLDIQGSVLMRYNGRSEDVQIPEGVKAIFAHAFQNRPVVKVQCLSTLETIGSCAFQKCIDLKEVILNEGLIKIKHHAFAFCLSLESLQIPTTLQVIDENTFVGCRNLRRFPTENIQNLQWIDDHAFSDSGLESFQVPDSVQNPGSHIFSHCLNLKSIRIGSGIQEIREECFGACFDLERIEIAASVKTIRRHAFLGCRSLKSISYAGKDICIYHGNPDVWDTYLNFEKAKREYPEALLSCENAFNGC